MSSHPVAVKRVIQSTTTEPGAGERLQPGSLAPTVTHSIIQLNSADGTVHVRLYGHDADQYPPGAEYDISITPRGP
jgi:hypothetical protein